MVKQVNDDAEVTNEVCLFGFKKVKNTRICGEGLDK